ncbi:hypothetical protein FRC12_019059 [Ceratobasidium sp. 428]|nr:hypothetical protein FRC12_019059 [Ceratobasidium sp. 428]
MVIKLHGIQYSTCTRRVLTTAQEIGVKIELVPVDLAKGEHKTEEFIAKKQPFGIIPVLEDEDGFQIYESRAIARYLVVKYGNGSSLLPPPTDIRKYALFEQAASIEYSSFDPPCSGLVFERMFAEKKGLKPNEAVAEKHHAALKSKLDGYERILSKQKYLAGDVSSFDILFLTKMADHSSQTYTLADLFHLPYGALCYKLDPELYDSRPSVKRWWDDITSREAWKAANNF